MIFEGKDKVIFEVEDMSRVSFKDTDITRVKFGDMVRWGSKDRFRVMEDERFWPVKSYNTLDGVLSVYRNLRENYEHRLRYDDAGKFFIREMELKRHYRNVRSEIKNGLDKGFEVKKNRWFRRNFSLTGLYHIFSNYGESIWRPTTVGAVIVVLSTLLWLTQSDPTLQPSFSQNNTSSSNISNFTGTANFANHTHLIKSFERSIAGFIPLLPMESDIKVGAIDYVIKIVGGALTFGLLIIAFRRKFERKYTR